MVDLNTWLVPTSHNWGPGHEWYNSFKAPKDSSQTVDWVATGPVGGEVITVGTATYNYGATYSGAGFTAPGNGTLYFDLSLYIYGIGGACSGGMVIYNQTADTYSDEGTWTVGNGAYTTNTLLSKSIAVSENDVCYPLAWTPTESQDGDGQILVNAATYWRGYFK